MGLIKQGDGWRLPGEIWQQVGPLFPARKSHPLGWHNSRASDRAAMNAVLFVLRTGARAGGKTGSHPADRGKGGIKRSLLTEAHGIPLAIVLDGASIASLGCLHQSPKIVGKLQQASARYLHLPCGAR